MKGLMRASPSAKELFGGLALSCLPASQTTEVLETQEGAPRGRGCLQIASADGKAGECMKTVFA